jgi:hypothetical protein
MYFVTSGAGVVDERGALTLDRIRESLIQQEDTIIFSLIERARYKINKPTYDPTRFSVPGFQGSLLEFMFKETECLHAKVTSHSYTFFFIFNVSCVIIALFCISHYNIIIDYWIN